MFEPNQYNDRWVWPPPHPLAHGYPNTRGGGGYFIVGKRGRRYVGARTTNVCAWPRSLCSLHGGHA